MLTDKEIQRIKDEAEKYKPNGRADDFDIMETGIVRNAYILGATTEAERAQRMAIAFAEWLAVNKWSMSTFDGSNYKGMWMQAGNSEHTYPAINELFTLFLKQYKD